MGAMREAGFRFGQGLGMACCAFAHNRPADGEDILRKALDPGSFLAQNKLIVTPIDGITTLPQCEMARDRLAGELRSADAVIFEFYDLGLNLGVALGHTLCAPADWHRGASDMFGHAVSQALEALAPPAVANLLPNEYRDLSALQSIGQGPQDMASGATRALIDGMAATIAQAA
jgi:hypothetical protein